GFKTFGAKVGRQGEQYVAQIEQGQRLRGARFFLDYPSVTGTMNLIFAAALAEGHTTLVNAAGEPEIVSVIDMLNRMGAKISGAGASLLEIDGVSELHGVRHQVIPDRL